MYKVLQKAYNNLDDKVFEEGLRSDELAGYFRDPAVRDVYLQEMRRRRKSAALRRVAARRVAEKWIQQAIEKPGRLHEFFGIPEDEDIPVAKIKGEIAKLKKKEKRSAEETSLLRALNMALTLKGMNKGAASWTPERRLISALNAVADAISHASLLAREAHHARRDAGHALNLLEAAEQVLGRDVARNLSLPGYRMALTLKGMNKKKAALGPVSLGEMMLSAATQIRLFHNLEGAYDRYLGVYEEMGQNLVRLGHTTDPEDRKFLVREIDSGLKYLRGRAGEIHRAAEAMRGLADAYDLVAKAYR